METSKRRKRSTTLLMLCAVMVASCSINYKPNGNHFPVSSHSCEFCHSRKFLKDHARVEVKWVQVDHCFSCHHKGVL